jgi:hypothetical protein
LFGKDHCFELELRAQRFDAQSQTLDKDEVIVFAVAHGARLAEQGIVATRDLHQSSTSAQMGQ